MILTSPKNGSCFIAAVKNTYIGVVFFYTHPLVATPLHIKPVPIYLPVWT
jgi:hypothetical protein